MAETLPSKKGAWVQSLVGEIGSHMSWGMAQHLKKKKNLSIKHANGLLPAQLNWSHNI